MWRVGRRLRQRLPPFRYFFSSKTTATTGGSGGGDPIPEIPTLYSFLQPSIFALRRSPISSPPPSPPLSPKSLTPEAEDASASSSSQSSLETALLTAVSARSTDDAWRAFKSLASRSLLPSPPAAAALLSHLASLRDRHSLKRAFTAALFLLERDPNSINEDAFAAVLHAMDAAAAPAPALALVRAALKNRFFPPFAVWGPCLAGIGRKNDCFVSFLRVFEESCRLALEEGIDAMKPNIDACNEVLDGCCRELTSVADAERLIEIMSALGMSPDSRSFGSLAFLYASQGLGDRVAELDMLMDSLGFEDKTMFFKNLISGYIKAANFEPASSIILRSLKERKDIGNSVMDEATCVEIVKGFVHNGRIKDLAALVIEAQEVESSQQPTDVNTSLGFKIVDACVGLGMLDKAHSMLDEMNARGGTVGLGVYSSILKAYCKEQRTAEAAQLVMEISAAGLQLDANSYDALIDASMTAQDFQSAFSLFRDMRDTRQHNLKTSYLTIMTGLMENQRPELMASYMDTIVDDPNLEIATHDWNSIIHAFCKVGRLEDAQRTYRRMVFLRYEPNNQTYLSLINGYVSAEKYFSVLMLWMEIKRKAVVQFDHDLVDAFLYALVKGGFFDAAMQVIEKAKELKIFVDKWRHKQAFMENHKKLKVSKLRKRNFRKMEALVAFKNWAGLNA